MSENFRERYRRLAANEAGASDAERLAAVIELTWDRAMKWSPESATHVGYEDADHGAWSDLSIDAVESRIDQVGDPLTVLDTIERAGLDPENALNYDLLRRDVEDEVAGVEFPGHLMPLDQMNGVHLLAPRLLALMPTRDLADYENIVSRLAALPRLIDETIELMGRGIAAGWTAPRVPLREVPGQIANLLDDDPLASPMLQAFSAFPDVVPEADRTPLVAEASAAFSGGIVPALGRLHNYVENTYLPAARESIAATALPDGEAWYGHHVRVRTTTDLTPAEIHETGLAEVARIRSEMDAVIAESGFEGGFEPFVEYLRSDSRFFFDQPEHLLAAYRDITKRADAELPRLFRRLPRLPYGVVAVPDYAAHAQPAAYYLPGSIEAGRPGYFFANTSLLDERPRWEMESLALHEAVPGHHLQIAIAQELEGIPEFRRHGGYMAYIEGWGLYSERLGHEMGFYGDPYCHFGRLMFEMWRAVRLVVDTGVHALGWSREQAIDYFRRTTGHQGRDVVVEVDRYIVWPGQALSYKIGELKINELRAAAETALGADFDLRGFHDFVLGDGSLPLDVLEQRVRAWIDARR